MCFNFSGYNAVHRTVLGSNSVVDTDLYIPTCLIRQHCELFANAFMAEAGELKIPYLVFTVPQFISGLSDSQCR